MKKRNSLKSSKSEMQKLGHTSEEIIVSNRFNLQQATGEIIIRK